MNVFKRCGNCKKFKLKKKFSKNRAKKDGLQPKCKICTNNYHRNNWYPKNKIKHMARVKKNKYKTRQINYKRVVEEHFIKGCFDCGEKDIRVLEFDHVRGVKKRLGKRTDGVSTLVRGGYSWLTIKKEIDKCEVRCRNCHKKKTWKEQNYFSDMKDFIDSKIKKDGTK